MLEPLEQRARKGQPPDEPPKGVLRSPLFYGLHGVHRGPFVQARWHLGHAGLAILGLFDPLQNTPCVGLQLLQSLCLGGDGGLEVVQAEERVQGGTDGHQGEVVHHLGATGYQLRTQADHQLW